VVDRHIVAAGGSAVASRTRQPCAVADLAPAGASRLHFAARIEPRRNGL